MDQAFYDTAERAGTDEDKLAAALRNLARGTCWGVMVSGKMGSGKDSCAAAVSKRLVPDGKGLCTLRFAQPVKDLLERLWEGGGAEALMDGFGGLSEEQAAGIWEECGELVDAARHMDTGSRDPKVRRALQALGGAMQARVAGWQALAVFNGIIDCYSKGMSVICTDGRLKEELEVCSSVGMTTIRLEADEEVRCGRILQRDGLTPSREALDHLTEVDLDDCMDRFDAVLDGRGEIADLARRAAGVHKEKSAAAARAADRDAGRDTVRDGSVEAELIMSSDLLKLRGVNASVQEQIWALRDTEKPDGRVEFTRIRMKRGRSATAVAVSESGEVVLIKQFRAPLGSFLIELPAGMVENGDEGGATAVRELEEETGWVMRRGTRPVLLGNLYPSPGVLSEPSGIYLIHAEEGEVRRPDGAEEYFAEVLTMALEDAVRLAEDGGFADMKTTTGILMAAARLAG